MLKLLSKKICKNLRKKKIAPLPQKILHIVLHGKLEKINEYVLYVKKESNMQINIDKLCGIEYFYLCEKIRESLFTF